MIPLKQQRGRPEGPPLAASASLSSPLSAITGLLRRWPVFPPLLKQSAPLLSPRIYPYLTALIVSGPHSLFRRFFIIGSGF